jgi:hypothetical protein
MNADVGILAFGSLIDDPGPEIEATLVGRKANIRTPFGVEFAVAALSAVARPRSYLFGKVAVGCLHKFSW